MSKKQVLIYVSDDCSQCKKVIKLLENNDISFREKNVTQNKENMKELQERGIYGTPAVFVEGSQVIQGYQKNKLKYALGIGDFESQYDSMWNNMERGI